MYKSTRIFIRFFLLNLFVILMSNLSWAQLYWRTDGTAGTWTSTNWGSSALPTGGTAWTSGSNAIFNANSTVTYATTVVGNVTVANGITVTLAQAGTASGTTVRTYDVGTGSTLTWSGQGLSTSSGFGVIKNGAGIWNMGSQGNLFHATNGGFTINDGTVIVSGSNNFGGPGVILTLAGGTIQSSGTRSFLNPITLTGNHTHTSTGNATFSGTVGLGAATRTIINSTASGSRIFSGIISGTSGSGLIFAGDGAGQIYVGNASNSFTGTITINGGEVGFASDGAFGNANNTIVIDGGRLTSSSTAGAAITSTWSTTHSIQLGQTAGTSISVQSSTGDLTYNGVLSDKTSNTGILVKQGSGTLRLGGVSTYTGATSINNGTLQLITGNDRLPISTVLNLGQAASTNLGIFDLNGFNQTIAGLNTTTGIAITGNNSITSTTAATLTISSSTSNSFGSTLAANPGTIGGAISIVKSGIGTQTFGGANTYTGNTTITAGELRLNPSVNTSLPGSLIMNGGILGTSDITATRTLTFSSFDLADNSNIDLNPSSDHTISFTTAGIITAGKMLTIYGWQGTAGASGTNGKIIFGSSAAALTAGQLAQIQFNSGSISSPGTNSPAIILATGEIVPSAIVLAVNFENFTAIRQDNKTALLNWKVGQSDNLQSFKILRSANGRDFVSIATVNAVRTQNIYPYTDNNATAEKIYYRIKAIEISTQEYVSEIRLVNLQTTGISVLVYPNPVYNNQFTVSVNKAGNKTVQIFSATGGLFREFYFTYQAKEISTSEWPRGYYFIRVITADGKATEKKIIIQ